MSRLPSDPSETSQWSTQMWWAPLSMVTASSPSSQIAASVQLLPTIVRLRTMTLTDEDSRRRPVNVTPGMPRMVLFEPTRTSPATGAPSWITAGAAPATAAVISASVPTTTGGASPPPVVVSTPRSGTPAQPTGDTAYT